MTEPVNQSVTCADCGLELSPDESWVCEECSTSYAIYADPNGYMTGEEDEQTH